MSTGHLHTVSLDDNKFHHLFNLMFLSEDEISVVQHALHGKPIPQEKLNACTNVKKSVDEIINMAIVRNTQPDIERIDGDEVEGTDKEE